MLHVSLLISALLISTVASAADPFDGTWRIDPEKTEFSQKPIRMELMNGRFRCSDCSPKIDIKADGTDQKISGSSEYEMVSVNVIDDRTVEFTYRKGGRLIASQKDVVNADGNRLTASLTSYPENGSKPATATWVDSRVMKGTPGSHAISGGWKRDKMTSASSNQLTRTIKITADGITMTDPTGFSYVARFDGKDYPTKGDSNTDAVSLRKIDATTFEETDKKNGKVAEVDRYTVSPDGRSVTIQAQDKNDGRTEKYVLVKQ